jgi:hypothetical protein
MHVLVFFALAPVYLIGFLGIGGAGSALFRLPLSPAGKLVFGLAIMLLWGGALNAAGWATVWPLYVPLILGFGNGLWQVRAGVFGEYRQALATRSARRGWMLVAGTLCVFFAFYSFNLLSPDVMNHHDDLANYLSHPAAMLETGTVYTGPLGSISLQTLGGMAVFHGLVAAPFGLEYVNAADAVFGLLVLVVVLADVALRYRMPVVAAALVIAAALFISPQYVNITALYLGSAMLAALALLPLLLAPGEADEAGPFTSWKSGLCAGLMAGALLVMKMSLLVPAFLMMAALSAYVLVKTRSMLRAATWALGGLVATATQLVVWLLVQRDRLAVMGGGGAERSAFAERLGEVESLWSLNRIWSRAPLLYADGATLGDHHLIVFAGFAVGVLALLLSRKKISTPARDLRVWTGFVALALVASWVVFLVLIQIRMFELNMGVRYVAPAIIGLFPAICLIALATQHWRQSRPLIRSSSLAIGGLAALLLCVGAFNDAFWARQTRTQEFGSMLGYLSRQARPALSQYTEFVLSDDMYDSFSQVQALTPRGSSVAVWVMTPHLVDFEHNDVFLIRPGGLSPTLTGLDITDGADALNEYLQARGVEYVFWQKSGFAVRDESEWRGRAQQSNIRSGIAVRALALNAALAELEAEGVVLGQNQDYTIFALPQRE